MRIVYDFQIFAEQKYGGISRYFSELARELNKRGGVQPRILVPVHVNQYLAGLDKAIVRGWKSPMLPKSRAIRLAINQRLYPGWEQHELPDVVHRTYFFPEGDNRDTTAPTVVTVHDMLHEMHTDSFAGDDPTAAAKLKAVHEAAHVICVSNNTRNDLLEHSGLDPARVSVVHHGHRNNINPSELPAPLQGRPYVLYVGERRRIYKNFALLLRAFANSNELRNNVRLVCFGGGGLRPEEMDLAASLGLSPDDIKCLQGSDHALAALYRDAQALVYPSRLEGFGLPLLEAMSWGCPVVCSNSGPFPEVAGDAAEYFDPLDADDLAAGLSKVLTDHQRAAELAELGKLRLQRFSWEKCAEQTLNVYRAATQAD